MRTDFTTHAFHLCANAVEGQRQGGKKSPVGLRQPRVHSTGVQKCTCAQREGGVPHFVEVAVDAVQAELPFVGVVTAALAVASASSVAVTLSVSVTRRVRAAKTGFQKHEYKNQKQNPKHI